MSEPTVAPAAPSSLRGGLLQQRQGPWPPSKTGHLRCTRDSSPLGVIQGDVPGLAEFKALFKYKDALVKVSLVDVELPDPGIRPNEAKGIIHRLSDLGPFFSSSGALGEHSQLGQGPAQVPHGNHQREGRSCRSVLVSGHLRGTPHSTRGS